MRLPTYTIVEYENPTKLLVRKEFPVDEYVWLEKDDVANGDDTVVKKAIEWINNPVGVENKSKKTLRTEITLSQNYPNPFNPATTIKYTVPYPQTDGVNGEWPAPTLAGAIVKNVTLKIFDVLGREVATLVNEKQKPGSYKVTWNAADQPSGVYFYKLTAGEFSQSKKLALLK